MTAGLQEILGDKLRLLGRKNRVVAALAFLAVPLCADQGFVFWARGRIYEVLTRRMGVAVEFPGHWLYEPSVITPSALTGGSYILLFSSNLNSGQDIGHGEAIFLSKSPDGYSHFTTPVPILTNTAVTDLCDWGDARPVWDGSAWHVYVYAVRGDYRSNKCDATAVVAQATGPDLFSLSWVTYPGTSQMMPIVAGEGSAGVAQEMQWFNVSPSQPEQSKSPFNRRRARYPGAPAPAPDPFLMTYNDWGHGNTDLLGLLSDASDNPQSWYEIPTAYSPAGTLVLPDAILAHSLDEATLGDPAIGFASSCLGGDYRYQYVQGIGYYDNVVPSFTAPAPTAGSFFPGLVESNSNDPAGPRMFSPRLARNEYGYIDPLPDAAGLPRIWRSYLYYNDAQVGNPGQCGYSRWFSSGQRFSVSYFEIREE